MTDDVLAYGNDALSYGKVAVQSGQGALSAPKSSPKKPGSGKPGSTRKEYPRSPFKQGQCLISKNCAVGSHSGLDVFFAGLDIGEPVLAMEDCTVVDVMGSKEWSDTTANAVIVQDSEGFITVYAHVAPIGDLKGKSIPGGTTIGRVDVSGSSKGAHVHLMRLNPGPASYGDVVQRTANNDYICNFSVQTCTNVPAVK